MALLYIIAPLHSRNFLTASKKYTPTVINYFQTCFLVSLLRHWFHYWIAYNIGMWFPILLCLLLSNTHFLLHKSNHECKKAVRLHYSVLKRLLMIFFEYTEKYDAMQCTFARDASQLFSKGPTSSTSLYMFCYCCVAPTQTANSSYFIFFRIRCRLASVCVRSFSELKDL